MRRSRRAGLIGDAFQGKDIGREMMALLLDFARDEQLTALTATLYSRESASLLGRPLKDNESISVHALQSKLYSRGKPPGVVERALFHVQILTDLGWPVPRARTA